MPRGLVLLGALFFPCAAAAQTVTDTSELAAAIQNARPGAMIVLADGTYTLDSRLSPQRGGTAASRITVRAQNQNAAIIETNGNEEAFQITVPYWTFDGLHVLVNNGSTHAYKLEGNGANTIIRNGKMELISGAEAGIKGAGGPSAPNPDNVLIEGNEIWFDSPTVSFNSEGIDAVAVANWVIRGNVIHDIQKDSVQFDGIAYGVFTKGNSQNTIIENNLFYDCFIPISLGGGGTGAQFFRDGDTTYEDRNGTIRNNMALNSRDVAVYLNTANGARIYNNTFYNSFMLGGDSAIDIRFYGSTADIRNNILDRPILDRDMGTHTEGSNLVLSSPTFSAWFVNAGARDLRIRNGTPPIDRGERLVQVTTDIDGTPRPQGAAFDIGAHELVGGVAPPSDAGVPRPDSGTPRTDGGTPRPDGGTPRTDAGTGPRTDSGGVTPPPVDAGFAGDTGTPNPADPDAGTSRSGTSSNRSTPRGTTGGCACVAAPRPMSPGLLALLLAFALGTRRRLRQRT